MNIVERTNRNEETHACAREEGFNPLLVTPRLRINRIVMLLSVMILIWGRLPFRFQDPQTGVERQAA